MSGTFMINLGKPVTSVEILTVADAEHTEKELGLNLPTLADSTANLVQDLEKQKAETAQLYQVLGNLVDKVSKFYDELLAKHKEEIARLSVEIARKILIQKVRKGDYQIEAIVKEAIRNAPVHQDMVVHLNPADLAQLRKLQYFHTSGAGKGDSGSPDFIGIEFVADSNIGLAECLVETPKGIIKSLIDEHLARISEAFEKAQ